MEERLQVSSRDEGELRSRLASWLVRQSGVGADATIDAFERPEANGMSSETLMFDASWGGATRRYVARLCPADDAFPIFPSYDLERQARVMRLVGERSTAPVPAVGWYEPDPGPLGAPFFVMDRVDGQVPPDVMPYPFDGTWVSEATADQRARLQSCSVDVLAAIHGVEAAEDEIAFLEPAATGPDDSTPLARHFAHERAFHEWARGDVQFPVVVQAFDWLEQRWPHAADAGPSVICWGDARIGNIMYEDFEPQAVLDWEMATLGPRELDVGWFIFLHRFFEDITHELGMAGLPDFLVPEQVAAQYAERSGHEPQDLDWFIVYAAVRHASVMIRAIGRSVHFGEREMPENPQDMVMHRHTLARLISEGGQR